MDGIAAEIAFEMHSGVIFKCGITHAKVFGKHIIAHQKKEIITSGFHTANHDKPMHGKIDERTFK